MNALRYFFLHGINVISERRMGKSWLLNFITVRQNNSVPVSAFAKSASYS